VIKPRFHPRSHAEQGFGLVELLVGVVIALMTSLAIFQTFAVNEEQRRTTSSGSEGLQQGTLAMAQIQAIVRNAGYNLVTPTDPALLMPTRTVVLGAPSTISSAAPAATEFLMGCVTQTGRRMAPVTVTAGPTAIASDTITVIQGSSTRSPIPAKLETAVGVGATDLTITSTYGYAVNDWVLIYEQNATLNPGVTRPIACTLARVISLPSAPVIDRGTIRLSVGTAAAYSDLSRVVNLGQNPQGPQVQRLSVINNRLTLTNMATGVAQPIADNVISMKVQVGVDITADDLIDEWTNPPPLPTDWLNPNSVATIPSIATLPVAVGPRSLNEMKALRVGLLIRSPQFERPNTAGACVSSGAGPFEVLGAVAGNAAQRIPDMPGSGAYNLAGNQRCYRYNTVTNIIPLRNMIMSEL
jgi:type IV pilus assembly protein PilW